MGSLEYKAAHYDPAADMASPDRQGQNIYVLWHEYLLLPFYLRGNCNTTLVVSRHRDADILSRAAYHLGFELVRGSSGRGGLSALRELLRRRRMNVAMTPDGPRGPRRVLASGAIYLAAKARDAAGRHRHRLRSPLADERVGPVCDSGPCSRARAVLNPAITIPPDLEAATSWNIIDPVSNGF